MDAVRTLIVVTTCERKGKSYLPDTLRSLDAAGARDDVNRFDKLVLSDGPFDAAQIEAGSGWAVSTCLGGLMVKDESGGTRIEIPEERIGAKHSLWAAFDLALRGDYERLFVFEDDIIASKNAVMWALSNKVPSDSAFVTYFDLAQVFGALNPIPVKMEVGFYKTPMKAFMAAQALCFPIRTVAWLHGRRAVELPWCGMNDRDTALCHMLQESPWPHYTICHPSLFQHVGETTSIDGGRSAPKAPSYQGDDFDALSLGPPFNEHTATILTRVLDVSEDGALTTHFEL